MDDIFVKTEIDSYSVIDALTGWDYEQIVEFIKVLDDTIGDWDFTRQLRDYFVVEMQRFEEDER